MERENQIALIIVFASVGMLIIVVAGVMFIFFFKRKMATNLEQIQELEREKKLVIFKSASEAEEREREKIARNLHDEVNYMLAMHKQNLEKHAFDFESNSFDIDDFTSEIASIEKISEAIRSCATNLVPEFLLKNGLITTLEDHIRQINTIGKLKARFNGLLKISDATAFGKQEELNIYRICLELLNNILKHAGPKTLTMTISTTENGMLVQIDHDGKKISTEEVESLLLRKHGLGLKSIKARSMMLNASITYSADEAGPSVLLHVPFALN